MWGCWSARWALRGAQSERRRSGERAKKCQPSAVAVGRGGCVRPSAVSGGGRGGQPWRSAVAVGSEAAGGWGRDLRLAAAFCATAPRLTLRAFASGAVPCRPCRQPLRARSSRCRLCVFGRLFPLRGAAAALRAAAFFAPLWRSAASAAAPAVGSSCARSGLPSRPSRPVPSRSVLSLAAGQGAEGGSQARPRPQPPAASDPTATADRHG